jgi:hypothetical protein
MKLTKSIKRDIGDQITFIKMRQRRKGITKQININIQGRVENDAASSDDRWGVQGGAVLCSLFPSKNLVPHKSFKMQPAEITTDRFPKMPFVPPPFMLQLGTSSYPFLNGAAAATNLFPAQENVLEHHRPESFASIPCEVRQDETFIDESGNSKPVKRTSNYVGVHWHRGAGEIFDV